VEVLMHSFVGFSTRKLCHQLKRPQQFLKQKDPEVRERREMIIFSGLVFVDNSNLGRFVGGEKMHPNLMHTSLLFYEFI